MVLAVLERRSGVPLRAADVYLSTIGGVRVTEPASDLAVAMAVASAAADRSLTPGTVAFGEVGLAGEIRPVTGALRRLSEAARLGFSTAIVPPGLLGTGTIPDGIRVIEAPDLDTAVRRGSLHGA